MFYCSILYWYFSQIILYNNGFETKCAAILRMSATLQDALHRFFKPALLPTPHVAEMANITSPGSTPFEVEDKHDHCVDVLCEFVC